MVCIGSFIWSSCLRATEYQPRLSPVCSARGSVLCLAGDCSDPCAMGWGYNLKNRARPQPGFTVLPIDKISSSPHPYGQCLHSGPALCTHVLSWRWAIHKPGTSRLPTFPGGLRSRSWHDGLSPQQKPSSLCPFGCHTLPG